MRFSFLSALLTVVFFFNAPQGVLAAVWVEQISGDAKAIVIVRKGDFLKAKEMMRLQPGDVVKVLDGKASVRILLGSGVVKSVNKAKSPYKVAGKEGGSSFLSNLVGEVKQMLVASSEQTEAVAMMTRGRTKQLKVLGAGAEENLILAGSPSLTLVWHGGKAPYNISLLNEDDDKPLVFKTGLSELKMVLETGKIGEAGLESGEYQILVEEKGSKPSTSLEVGLLLVERDELPDNAQKLLELALDKRVEARLLINLLHKQPEWRLFAYSLAVHHGLEKERLMLELMK